jgi:dipeptidyl aminopeptidase/acylaminoacyl peptidase
MSGALSLVVIDAANGRTRTLATDALRDYGITVSWAPSGHRIAYADTAGLVVVGAERSGAPLDEWKVLRHISRSGLRFRSDYTPPLWSADATRLYAAASDSVWEAKWSDGTLRSLGTVTGNQVIGVVGDFGTNRIWPGTGGDAVYAVVRHRSTLRMGFARFALGALDARHVWSADILMQGPRFGAAPASDGTVAFIAQDAAHPQEIWLFSTASSSARRVSALHKNLGRYALGESRLVSWRSATGDTLRGALLLPPSYEGGKRYPLIVHVYAGSTPSRNVNQFGLGGGGAYNQQLLAARGYAVLLPDVPLSGGKPVDDLEAAVLPAVDRLIALGIADSARVGVTGYSSGGYSTLALLTRSSRFAAAIAEQGFASLMGDYLYMRSDGSSPGIARVEGYGDGMGGPPWGDRLEAYIAQSPLFHLDRITTPLLLVHGDADEIVPSSFSGEVFVGLRRLGKPVVIALYEGEGHGTGAWRRANMDDYLDRVLAWWQRWLGDYDK